MKEDKVTCSQLGVSWTLLALGSTKDVTGFRTFEYRGQKVPGLVRGKKIKEQHSGGLAGTGLLVQSRVKTKVKERHTLR
jgi:hypothetical protein